MDARGIEAEIVAVNCDEEEGLKKIGADYDAFVSMDTYGSPDTAVPLCKVGSSDFYFAVSKDRPDLLAELDAALNNIQNEDKYYDQKLHDKYLKSTETDKYLGNTERRWLAEHGAIRVGYQDNYLAFCAKDKKDGDLTGALKDYLDYASSAFMNQHIEFETIVYPTASDAIDALKKGEIDCVFPSNLTSYDAQMLDLVMSPPLMRTEMDAVVRESVQKEFVQKKSVTVAVNEGNTNYDLFLEENYPGWERTYFKDTPQALEAVAAGSADCVIISNYRYSNISKQCEKLHLATVYTGVDMDFCFAVNMGDPQLYSILSSITRVVPDSVVNTALTYYSTEDVKTTFADLIKDNLFLIMAVIATILMLILMLLLHSIRAERKILEEERLVKDLNKRAFVDSLTSVRNKGAYYDYIKNLQKCLDREEISEFAVGIFDCNDLKKINDEYGHDKGDIYLKAASRLICTVYEHSPVFRIGGDEFAVFLLNTDFENREELLKVFENRRSEICGSA
ncbi:MAG: transporter substrate-binding domain-containing protein [Lachnospiraceae bacterium]|nr:transporter substrate-binding domain-containing protein [Lachnospiraceae bacterium]